MGHVTNPLNPVQMKKNVKALVLLTISCSLFLFSQAQLKLPVANAVGADLKKIIEDYPNRFINLLGEMKAEHEQTTDYYCNCSFKNAEEITLTRYSATKKSILSWQATMLTTEDFNEAKQKFKSLYSQINNLAIHVGERKNDHLKGVYESPAEEKKFSAVLFSVDSFDEGVKKLKVELTMEFYAPMEWKVKVLVYEREREDDQKGASIDE